MNLAYYRDTLDEIAQNPILKNRLSFYKRKQRQIARMIERRVQ